MSGLMTDDDNEDNINASDENGGDDDNHGENNGGDGVHVDHAVIDDAQGNPPAAGERFADGAAGDADPLERG